MRMSNEAIGAYIRALVDAQPGLTLGAVLRTAGLAANYLGRMEKKTKEPSARTLIKLVRAAGGTVEHLEMLSEPDANAAFGQRLGREWLDLTEEQRTKVVRIYQEHKHVIALNDGEPYELIDIIGRIRSDLQKDPDLLKELQIWLDGRRSRN